MNNLIITDSGAVKLDREGCPCITLEQLECLRFHIALIMENSRYAYNGDRIGVRTEILDEIDLLGKTGRLPQAFVENVDFEVMLNK